MKISHEVIVRCSEQVANDVWGVLGFGAAPKYGQDFTPRSDCFDAMCDAAYEAIDGLFRQNGTMIFKRMASRRKLLFPTNDPARALSEIIRMGLNSYGATTFEYASSRGASEFRMKAELLKVLCETIEGLPPSPTKPDVNLVGFRVVSGGQLLHLTPNCL